MLANWCAEKRAVKISLIFYDFPLFYVSKKRKYACIFRGTLDL